MNKQVSYAIIALLSVVAIFSIYSFFTLKSEFKQEINTFRQSTDSAFYHTKKQVTVLEYGMDQDGVRRRKILAVEAIIKSVNDTLSPELIQLISKTIVDETEKPTPVTYPMLCALLAQESSFDPTKTSVSGAKGIAQIVRLATEFVCEKLKIPYSDKIAYDPVFGVKAAWYYLNYCIVNNDGNVELALAEYNNGPQYGSWRYKCFKKQQAGQTLDSLEKYGADNISEETKNYAPSVMTYEKRFCKFIDNISIYMDRDSLKVSFPKRKKKG